MKHILTAVVMIIAIFWRIAPCRLCMNQRYGGTYHLRLQDWKSAEQESSVHQVAIHCLDTRHYVPEDGSIQNERRSSS
jgi:hypothetical protein